MTNHWFQSSISYQYRKNNDYHPSKRHIMLEFDLVSFLKSDREWDSYKERETEYKTDDSEDYKIIGVVDVPSISTLSPNWCQRAHNTTAPITPCSAHPARMTLPWPHGNGRCLTHLYKMSSIYPDRCSCYGQHAYAQTHAHIRSEPTFHCGGWMIMRLVQCRPGEYHIPSGFSFYHRSSWWNVCMIARGR